MHFVRCRMTSTNFNVGLSDGRNSSRVLKPPGGGHTDIFGVQHSEEPRTKHAHSKTEISECFASNYDNGDSIRKENGNTKEENTQPKEEIIKSATVTDDKQATVENSEQVADENLKPAEEQKTAQPSRVRVPPGGFSSGFW